MKTTTCTLRCRSADRIPYPNAATRRENLQKFLDALLIAASGMGIAAMLLLMMVL